MTQPVDSSRVVSLPTDPGTAGPAPSLEASYRYCRDVTRREAKNFYFAFWLLPRDRRDAIFAIYTFSRRLDDVVDRAVEAPEDLPEGAPEAGANPELAARRGLDYMRSLLNDDAPADDALVPALHDTVRRFRIPRKPFDELVAGMVMDLEGHAYETFEDMRRYCYRAASTVGLICLEIFGYEGQNASEEERRARRAAIEGPAIDLGLAMQLTNILRDIGEDLRRGRVYLPSEELERFGVTQEMLDRRQMTPQIRELLRFQMARAREYFQRSEALFPHLPAVSRFCPVLLKRIYSEILDQIERADYDVFTRRARLSRPRKVWLATTLWLKTLLVR